MRPAANKEVTMAFYRACTFCGAHLDPGERCDCQNKEKTTPDAANIKSGEVEKGLPTNFSTSHFTEE